MKRDMTQAGQQLENQYLSASLLYALFQSAVYGAEKYAFNNGLVFEVNAMTGRFRYVAGAFTNFDDLDHNTGDHVSHIQELLEEHLLGLLREKSQTR